jgi:NADPH-dependent 2,4-dienoyl-CoA reductase/sulfur reductase-like enzyme
VPISGLPEIGGRPSNQPNRETWERFHRRDWELGQQQPWSAEEADARLQHLLHRRDGGGHVTAGVSQHSRRVGLADTLSFQGRLMALTHCHVIVIGAGIGGLTAALSLQRYGFKVSVYEQASAY